jgi:hypothetical protein
MPLSISSLICWYCFLRSTICMGSIQKLLIAAKIIKYR